MNIHYAQLLHRVFGIFKILISACFIHEKLILKFPNVIIALLISLFCCVSCVFVSFLNLVVKPQKWILAPHSKMYIFNYCIIDRILCSLFWSPLPSFNLVSIVFMFVWLCMIYLYSFLMLSCLCLYVESMFIYWKYLCI